MFYDIYKKLCDEHNEKPYRLPLKLGAKSNSVVAQWQKGGLPRPDMLKKIAEHFNVSVDYLLGHEQKEKSTPEGEQLSEITLKLIERIKRMNIEQQSATLLLLNSLDKQEG